ncbi:hypothetical protein PHYBLDRAFT_171770 [Phycomyces blakesleeanus NRRL 1555(-)]|nr:hypothetical protein PHYBLDRAFT_171770 [Phycomyces blakesleeanus NRRL 1555(-)]OAD69741.1 hypothetical protein PHYBLDRAFT_171770 [Phycomyces blakesleeanus NRRL 1555(-)]|eukprot:XP_018287781.1 hypothetical protein PHYBLDRAFT_171770 [Phycomyces blakesleeanus NRRL 1555(-)]
MRGRNQFIRGVVEKIFFCFGRVTVKTGFVYSSAWTLLGADQTVLGLLDADQTVLETIGCGPDGFGDYWVRTRRFWRLLGADQTVLETIGCGPDGFGTIGCGPDGFGDYWVRTRRF